MKKKKKEEQKTTTKHLESCFLSLHTAIATKSTAPDCLLGNEKHQSVKHDLATLKSDLGILRNGKRTESETTNVGTSIFYVAKNGSTLTLVRYE